MQEALETQIWPLDWEDPLEEEMATHSNILAWESPLTEKPGRLQSIESKKVGHDWLSTHTYLRANREDRNDSFVFQDKSVAPSSVLLLLPEIYLYLAISHCSVDILIFGLPRWFSGKESACQAGYLGWIPGSGRSPEEGNGWLPTPGLLPGKCLGQRSLVGYSPWDHKRVRHNLVTKQQQQSLYYFPC